MRGQQRQRLPLAGGDQHLAGCRDEPSVGQVGGHRPAQRGESRTWQRGQVEQCGSLVIITVGEIGHERTDAWMRGQLSGRKVDAAQRDGRDHGILPRQRDGAPRLHARLAPSRRVPDRRAGHGHSNRRRQNTAVPKPVEVAQCAEHLGDRWSEVPTAPPR